ncbi:MAG: phospholipid/cholesterol/gamma-HCH transport system permease protein [Actinomycetota bacterium]|jgi:phospholipid/cholesterol/gamma-HCH transport system permease protein
MATRFSDVIDKPKNLTRETGNMFAIALEALRRTWDVRQWYKEYLDQCWFIAKVTSIPVVLISIPFGAVIALHVGSFSRQLGAESNTGAAMVLAIVREAAPVAVALLIAGAGGSAMTADLGSRKIRDEISAMEVMAVNPIHRLVTPRMWAAATVSVLLVPLVSVAGLAGGFVFNVLVQHVTAGAYFSGFTVLVQPADLWSALAKAFLFGLVAAMVACYKGLYAKGGPKGVGDAVNQAVVLSFIMIFFVNFVMTTLYFAVIPQKF